MKKKALLSSLLTIALCLCLIAGSTFALFTDRTEFNIAVTSGDVEILATAAIDSVYSAVGTDGAAEDKYLVEKNHNYEHKNMGTTLGRYIFENGGEASVVNGSLNVTRITPGDRVDMIIKVDNKSDVAIVYRYKIIAAESKLATGMVVTIDGKSYEGLASYTSEWYPVVSAADGIPSAIADKIISIELPVYAGDEFQTENTEKDVKSLSYTVIVEAVQGNAVTDNEAQVTVFPTENALADALANGGRVVLKDDFNTVLNIGADANAALNLDGAALNDNVVNRGTVEIADGAINANAANSNACGFQNNGGTATLTDVVINAGDSNDYSNISHGGSVTYNNVEINANGGGIGALNGAQVVFNGGSVAITSTTTNPRYNVYAAGDGTTVTINGGDFSFASATLKRSYIYAGAGATVIVNGGTFGAACQHPSGQAPIIADGTVIITGGTFGFNPSAWVADGYIATEAGGLWTVTAE